MHVPCIFVLKLFLTIIGLNEKTLEHKKDLDKFWSFGSSSFGEMCIYKESSNLEDGARIVPLSGQSIYTCVYMQCIFEF